MSTRRAGSFLSLLLVLALLSAACGSDEEPVATSDDVDADLSAISLGDPDEGPIEISFGGFFFADENGPRLCATLAESFPPQCFDVVIEISGNTNDVVQFVDDAAAEDDSAPLNNVDNVWWTDDWTTLSGLLSDGKLLLDLG